MQPVNFNFKTLQRDNKLNSYLICPEHYCQTRVDAISPDYAVSVDQLIIAWQKMMAKQSRTTLLYHSVYDYQYVQRSLLFHFPDYIHVTFISLPNEKSTLAIYSHSVYGYYDLGVNKKRVEKYLAELSAALAAEK
jgi:uncharacterized protein (DUF1499 family)